MDIALACKPLIANLRTRAPPHSVIVAIIPPKYRAKSIKRTHHINRKTVQANFRAFDFAIHENRAFNRYVVLNMTDPDNGQKWAAFLKKYRRWLEHKRSVRGDDDQGRLRPCHLYTRENEKGLHHVNWVIWVPDELLVEFDKKVVDWAMKVGSAGRFDLKRQPIKAGTEKALANYINKDCDSFYREHFYLDQYTHESGPVVGPRTGMSPSIAVAAQNRAGFNARRCRRLRL